MRLIVVDIVEHSEHKDSIGAVIIVWRSGGKNNQNCSVLCCIWQLCTMIRTHTWAVYIFAC